jgi:hypothetical protein
MAIGKDGFIYIIDSSGGSALSFSRANGQEISIGGIYPRVGKLIPHPVGNMFYWVDTGVSPQDINALKYKNGVIGNIYDSPYHGDYEIGVRIKISPDGANIFTSAGNVFTNSNVQSADMIFKNKFTAFTDLLFDLPNNRMFASQGRANLNVYDYATYDLKGFVKTAFSVKEMTLNKNKILALSSENNAFYLEIIDSSAVLQILPERIDISAEDSVFMSSASYRDLKPVIVYNDGSSESIANTAVYTSSDNAIAHVDRSGRLWGNATGHAVITIEFEGISKRFDVYVDYDISSISVDEYDYLIDFSPSQRVYSITLRRGVTAIPTVTFDAPEYVFVDVTQATKLPGTAIIAVTDADGNYIKVYYIEFRAQGDTSQTAQRHFNIIGHYNIKGGFVNLNLFIDNNPHYSGAVPDEFSLVVQLINANDEPVLISSIANLRQIRYSFSEEYVAIITIVDKLGQQNYIGVQLADPVSI